jgi:hypothetical protein
MCYFLKIVTKISFEVDVMKIESMLSAAVIAFLLAHSSSVYSQQSIIDQERMVSGSEPSVAEQEAATVKKIETPSVVRAPEIIFNHKERDILERLKKARESGDRSTSRALISELDAMHGIAPAKEPASDVQTVALQSIPDAPLSEEQLKALQFTADSLVHNSSQDVVRPSMVTTPEGDIFVAMMDRDYSGAVWLYRSTDGGKTWVPHNGWTTNGGSANPSLAYMVDPDDGKPYIYIAYEGNSDSTGGDRLVMALWVSATNSGDWSVRVIKSGITMNGSDDHIYPEIATDYIRWPFDPYLYVTYAVWAIDYYPVYFTRSLDEGTTWTAPANITGGSENTSWRTRPHIAYGDAGLFVTFEKPGWTGHAPVAADDKADDLQLANGGGNVDVSQPVTPTVFEGDLSDLPRAPQAQPGDPVIEIPRRTYPRGGGGNDAPSDSTTDGEPDPLLKLQQQAPAAKASRAFGTPDLNFEGQSTNAVPPDPVGEVGIDYYIQMTNHPSGSTFTVYNKSSGSVAAGPTVLDTLATSGNCTSGHGDPIVLFDTMANRWLMSEFAVVGNHLCVYVSQTSNPVTGGWYSYDFAVPNFPDYPKYAVWPDAYYVSSNEPNPAVYALDRSSMLAGSAATYQRFTATDLAGFGFQALTPGDLDGAVLPPTGAPGYFIRHRDDEVHNPGSNNPSEDYLEIWEFDVDWTTPANSTFGKTHDIAISEFDSNLCGLTSYSCFPQSGTSVKLDPLREVVMWRLQYRNSGSHETLVGNLVTDVDNTDHGGIRWFELRKSGASWSLHQEGTYAPDSHSRWMGSIAMDKVGNMAMGYSVSSSSMFPGIRYVGRESTDTLGTMPSGEYTIINGGGYSSSNRWGDYSSMNVDPVDDCTFWYTMEYPTAAHTWNTRIARFAFDSCTNPGTWATQVWVTRSGNFGGSWGTPLQLTSFEDKQHHPRVAAANGGNSVVVAYTRDYGNSGDLDINYAYSTDGGSNWMGNRFLASTTLIEESVELAVSNSTPGRFHAAYNKNFTLQYRSANIAAPGTWDPETRVDNSGGYVSRSYPKHALAADPTRLSRSREAVFAWGDFRQGTSSYNVYFNRIDEQSLPWNIIYYIIESNRRADP